MIVWIDDWQIQCCGDPFKVKDTVTWTVVKWNFDTSNIKGLDKVDYYYENHDVEDFELIGTVEHIQCIYQKYTLDTKNNVYIPTEGILKDFKKEIATGYEENLNDFQFTGYLVTLNTNIN